MESASNSRVLRIAPLMGVLHRVLTVFIKVTEEQKTSKK